MFPKLVQFHAETLQVAKLRDVFQVNLSTSQLDMMGPQKVHVSKDLINHRRSHQGFPCYCRDFPDRIPCKMPDILVFALFARPASPGLKKPRFEQAPVVRGPASKEGTQVPVTSIMAFRFPRLTPVCQHGQ